MLLVIIGRIIKLFFIKLMCTYPFYALEAIFFNNKVRDVMCKAWNAFIRLNFNINILESTRHFFIIVTYYQQVSK